MKIRFIVPYMGEWPWWMPFYLVSCAHNRSFEWLLIGDNEPQGRLPDNVSFVRMNLAGINELATQKLGRKVDIQKPYKLCDLRIAFGKVFEDYLIGYDFWGHTDLDLVYGDIAGLIPDSAVKDFDIITPYSTSCGHFQLYRNRRDINSIFQQVDDPDAMLIGSEYKLYDHLKATPVLKTYKWYHIPDYQAEMRKDRTFLGATVMAGENIVYEEKTGDEVYFWDNGHAFQLRNGKKREFLYLHFMGLKNGEEFKVPGSRLQDAGCRMQDAGSTTPLLPSYEGQARLQEGEEFKVQGSQLKIAREGSGAADVGNALRRDVAVRPVFLVSTDGIREIDRVELTERIAGIKPALLGSARGIGVSFRRMVIALSAPHRLWRYLNAVRERKRISSALKTISFVWQAVSRRRKLGLAVSLRVFLKEHDLLEYDLEVRVPGKKELMAVRTKADICTLDNEILRLRS